MIKIPDCIKKYLDFKICVPALIILVIVLIYVNYSQLSICGRINSKHDNLNWHDIKTVQEEEKREILAQRMEAFAGGKCVGGDSRCGTLPVDKCTTWPGTESWNCKVSGGGDNTGTNPGDNTGTDIDCRKYCDKKRAGGSGSSSTGSGHGGYDRNSGSKCMDGTPVDWNSPPPNYNCGNPGSGGGGSSSTSN